MTGNALEVIAAEPPKLDQETIRRLLESEYGLQGEMQSLVSERDQNVQLSTANGDSFVLKIANAVEDPLVTDFQIRALLLLEKQAEALGVPVICRTSAGAPTTSIRSEAGEHVVRLVSWIHGQPMQVVPFAQALASRLGRRLAEIDRALDGFRHPGERQALLWDIQQASSLRELVVHIGDTALAAAVNCSLDDFESNVKPALSDLRAQVIHNDANPENIIVQDGRIAGIIDFGDMIRAPLIVEAAVAAAYLRQTEDNLLAGVLPMLAGYHDVIPLRRQELGLFFDLVRARLATTITLLYWRLSARSEDDPYRQKIQGDEVSAREYLFALEALGRDAFDAEIRAALSV